MTAAGSSNVTPVTSTIMMLLNGYVSAWNNTTPPINPRITVHQGDAVSISLVNGDGISNRLLVDFDNDGAGDVGDCGTMFGSVSTKY
jgi:hypothetical protein